MRLMPTSQPRPHRPAADVHRLIGAGVAAARYRLRWPQSTAAAALRRHGLTAWRTSTVGQLEIGLRRPRLDEIVLIAMALNVPVADLIPVTGELIELGDGVMVSDASIRAILCGSFPGTPDATPRAVKESPSDAERYAGRRLKVPPQQIAEAAQLMWGASFETERDSRVSDVEKLEPRSRQARRGLVAREMFKELRAFLDDPGRG
jgi:transcriptional regulator with XRE-family HTH domain